MEEIITQLKELKQNKSLTFGEYRKKRESILPQKLSLQDLRKIAKASGDQHLLSDVDSAERWTESPTFLSAVNAVNQLAPIAQNVINQLQPTFVAFDNARKIINDLLPTYNTLPELRTQFNKRIDEIEKREQQPDSQTVSRNLMQILNASPSAMSEDMQSIFNSAPIAHLILLSINAVLMEKYNRTKDKHMNSTFELVTSIRELKSMGLLSRYDNYVIKQALRKMSNANFTVENEHMQHAVVFAVSMRKNAEEILIRIDIALWLLTNYDTISNALIRRMQAIVPRFKVAHLKGCFYFSKIFSTRKIKREEVKSAEVCVITPIEEELAKEFGLTESYGRKRGERSKSTQRIMGYFGQTGLMRVEHSQGKYKITLYPGKLGFKHHKNWIKSYKQLSLISTS